MLRSFAYVEDAAQLLHGVDAPAGWEERCRESFLEGYRETVDPRLLPPSRPADRLLALFELQKLVYELRYEIGNRPDWVGIPVAGLASQAGGGERPERRSASSTSTCSARVATSSCTSGSARTSPRRGPLRRLGAERARRLGRGRLERWRGARPARAVGVSGIWEGVVAEADEGNRYKLVVLGADGVVRLKADPYAFQAEVPPATASSSTGRATSGATPTGSSAGAASIRSSSRSPSTRFTPDRGGSGTVGPSWPPRSPTTWRSWVSRTSS